MSISDKFAFGAIVIWLSCAVSWCANIYKLAAYAGPIATWGASEILRVIGIFVPPVGVVMGLV